MIFLSQLLHIPILDSRQEVIGRVKDLVAAHPIAKEYPLVRGVVFESRDGLQFIDNAFIESYGPGELTLSKANCWKLWEENQSLILLSRDILDQQIFDVKGIRVVRVNDLQLAKIGEDFRLFGIDISNKALLRRLGILFFPVNKMIKGKFIDWHNVNFIRGSVGRLKLRTGYQKLKQLHPADIANLIENLTLSQSTKVVQEIDKETAAEVLAEVHPQYKGTLLEKMNPKELAKILEEMSADDAADVLQGLSDDKRDQVFKRLGERKAQLLTKLSSYAENVAGGLMTTDYFLVKEDMTVSKTIQEIRKKTDELKSIYHAFVLDHEGKLKGVVSIRTLLLSKRNQKISELMSEVHATVTPDTPAHDVARLLTKYNLLSVAVVDAEGNFKGAITVDDVMRRLVPEA